MRTAPLGAGGGFTLSPAALRPMTPVLRKAAASGARVENSASTRVPSVMSLGWPTPRSVRAAPSEARTTLIGQGARTPDELLYGDEFRAFAEAHPGFRYLPCFSRTLPPAGSPQAHPDVRHGYVQNALAELAPDAAGDIAYLCGNPHMVDACFEALKAAGLPIPQIRREKYVSNK